MKKILLILSLFTTLINTYSAEEEQKEKGYKLDAVRVFGNLENKYRIPSLLYTKEGKLLALADARHKQLVDYGNFDTAIRISEDLGNTFGKESNIIDLANATESTLPASAFTIDPSLIENDNEILMLVDMFPKSTGTFTAIKEKGGSGYTEIDGKKYQNLNKYGDNQYKYYIDEEGVVFKKNSSDVNSSLEVTGLNVIKKAEEPFKELGDIYNTETKERIGNVYRGRLNGEKNTKLYDGDYIIDRTAYLWLTKSTDQGKTWSNPVDITPMVKKDYMSFLGTGPGVGIKLRNGEHKGRLIFPVYMMTTYNNGKRNDLTNQQSAVIYSDDNGVSWKISESIMEGRINPLNKKVLRETTPNLGGLQLTESQVVELNNGTLKLFMRGFHESSTGKGGGIHIGTSKDGGVTWENETEEFPFEAAYSQVAAIHYGNVGNEEFVLVSAPSNRSKRIDNKIYLGLVKGDNIEWIGGRKYVEGNSSYSSITKLGDGDVGILYEAPDGKNRFIDYTKVSLDWIAPNHIFKEFLPFQKEYTKLMYRKELSNILFENSTLGSDLDLEKGKTILRYSRGKITNKKYNSAEVYGIIKNNFGIYSRFTSFDDKDYSGNISAYALFENNYLSGYQTLGLDYVKRNDVNFIARGYKISIPNKDNLLLRASTKLKIKGFNINNFTLDPEASLDIQYLPKDERRAINHEDITLDLMANKIYRINTGLGLNLGYQGEKIKTELGLGVTNNHTSISFEDKEYKENRLGYILKSSIDFNASDKFSVKFKMKYSNDFNNKEFRHIKGGLEVNYTW